jgi:predicted N-acetyltransferase YhbS
MRSWRSSGDQSGPGGRRHGPALVTGRQPGAGQRPEIRRLTQDDDLAQVLDLARRSFGPFGADAAAARLADTRESVADGRHLGAFGGGRLIAAAKYFDMVQWWHGRQLPMAGVASVTVAPEARGQGAGRALMTALAGQVAARGYPLSALYPATAAVYRAVGYELAGAQYQASVPARSLRPLLPPDVAAAGQPDGRAGLRRAGPGDAAEISAVIGRVHEAARDCGPADFDLGTSARLLDDEHLFCYLAPDGFLAYRWQGGNSEVLVHCATAGSAATARALWSVVASHSSMAGTVRAFCGPADPVSWLTREPDVSLARHEPWMLRVIDARAAIAGRGFPASAHADVAVRLEDGLLPANAGLWRLSVRDGAGDLSRWGTDGPAGLPPAGPLTLGARGLAALYAGTPVAALRLAGLAAGGDPAADAALDGAFAGTAFMLDYF